MKPYLHTKNSIKKFGGSEEDYQPIHDFIDSSKAHWADVRHRAILHSSFGIFLVEQVFGHIDIIDGKPIKRPYIINSEGKKIQVRDIAEQHILDDLGKIPTVDEYLRHLTTQPWFHGRINKLEVEIVD